MEWIRHAVFYHIYPLGFCGAPPRNDGAPMVPRIAKIADWIPHLKSMNVTAVYLGPVFQSDEHGYDTTDYYQIDPRLGDRAVFRQLCGQLREAGIHIVLDGVFNHVGRNFWAFRDLLQNGAHSRYCNWFHNLDFSRQSPYGDPFCYESWQGHFNLVKLNLSNPEVVDHLIGAVGMWMDEFGINGLRLDAADCVEPNFFRNLRQFCKDKRPDFWLMGEIIHGDYNRLANESMLDSVTNYECYKGLYSSHNDKNYFEIAYSLNRQFGPQGIYRNLCLYNFADNHDVNRLASQLKDSRHLKNVYTLLYTMPGVPSIYYGSEWGIRGTKQNGSDAGLRPCLNPEHLTGTDNGLLQHLQKLGALRHALPVLQTGDYEQVLIRNEQFVFRRFGRDQAVFIALNLADHTETVTIPSQSDCLADLLTGAHYPAGSGSISVELPACSAMLLSPPCVLPEPSLRATQESIPQDLRPGRYRHFKGNEYRVLGIARHSETEEKLVVYQALYGDNSLWVRPLSMFLEPVKQGEFVQPRFTYLGN